MDRFEYVMVLVSIIVGLSLAHVLFGVGGIIDRRAGGPKIKLGLAHGLWLAYVFIWTLQFWWWEFRFSEIVSEWTLGLYLFLVGYAIALLLLAVILVPRDWDGVTDLDEYFLQRRVWFYWALAIATALDVVDSLLKGGLAYIIDGLGISAGLWAVTAVACVVGLRSRRPRSHRIAAAAVLLVNLLAAFNEIPTLGL